ncbi:MAG: hypothetical protein U0805_07855 [Pirellulales bacterium]
MAADEAAIKTELSDLDEIEHCRKDVMTGSAVYVRFHLGAATLPAEVK